MSTRVLALALGLALLGLPSLLTADETDAFGPIAAEYEAIRSVLAKDSVEGAADHAAKIQSLAQGPLTPARAGVADDAAAEVATLLPRIDAAAAKVVAAEGLDAVRAAFGELSAPVVRWFELRKDKGDWAIAYCPMADKNWLQPKAPEVENPFYGSEMLNCGRFVRKAVE